MQGRLDKMVETNERILIIEDNEDVLEQIADESQSIFELGATKENDFYFFDIEKTEGLLRNQKYFAILLDGNLNLGLDFQESDGEIIARRIRDGGYGNVNANSLIYGISADPDSFLKDSVLRSFSKPRNRTDLDYILNYVRKNVIADQKRTKEINLARCINKALW
jgi:hypothetical protein